MISVYLLLDFFALAIPKIRTLFWGDIIGDFRFLCFFIMIRDICALGAGGMFFMLLSVMKM